MHLESYKVTTVTVQAQPNSSLFDMYIHVQDQFGTLLAEDTLLRLFSKKTCKLAEQAYEILGAAKTRSVCNHAIASLRPALAQQVVDYGSTDHLTLEVTVNDYFSKHLEERDLVVQEALKRELGL